MSNSSDIANHFLKISQLLRGCYAMPEYHRVILPLMLLRRLDCVLAHTKVAVLAAHQQLSPTLTDAELDAALNDIAGQPYHNHSVLNLLSIRNVPREVQLNLFMYMGNFSSNVREVFDQFEFNAQITKLQEANLLFLVVKALCEIDLAPAVVSDIEMAKVFDQVFWQLHKSHIEERSVFCTPPDVARLTAELLFAGDAKRLAVSNASYTLFDPACGAGGMLLAARNYLKQHQFPANLVLIGQEIHREAWATAATRFLLDSEVKSFAIKIGDSLVDDQFTDQHFDYLCANPPMGFGWKQQQQQILQEHTQQGFAGRFGAGLPRISDGALLFLQHMLAKFKPASEAGLQTGSRMAIVLHAASLLGGDAGSGESDIRKWMIENDWLETVIALPPNIYYSTSVSSFICLLSNRKTPERRGKIQLIDARQRTNALLRNIGNKRHELNECQIAAILQDYNGMKENATTKIVDNAAFGYRRITVERPLRLAFHITILRKERFLEACPELLDDLRVIEQAIGYELQLDWNKVWSQVRSILGGRKTKWRMPQIKIFREIFTEVDANAMPVIYSPSGFAKGLATAAIVGSGLVGFLGEFGSEVTSQTVTKLATAGNTFFSGSEFEADPALRDYETVPLQEELQTWFAREVLPHAPDAWINASHTKTGYEINLHRYFYHLLPLRPLAEIDADLMQVEQRIANLLWEVTA